MGNSIFERLSKATPPSAQQITRYHLVTDGESLMSIANVEYGLEFYRPECWRVIANANGITNPSAFSSDYLGKRIIIPALPLPSFA
jgi:nucleoid-associated protein YgaU